MAARPAGTSGSAEQTEAAMSSPLRGINRYAVSHYLRRFGAVAVVTLVSGGFMAVGGYLFHTRGWRIGGVVMIPSGPTISAAFALLFRAERSRRGPRHADSTGAARRVRAIVTIAAGLPWTGGNAPLRFEIGTFGLTMAAGAVMALAGYAAAAWTWLLVPAVAIAAGVFIVAAFALATNGLHQSRSGGSASRIF
jgi:hypothetical protein